jgi:hypothetical protein
MYLQRLEKLRKLRANHAPALTALTALSLKLRFFFGSLANFGWELCLKHLLVHLKQLG